MTRTVLPGLLILGAACQSEPPARWQDQLVSDTPCMRVDLADGLDDSSLEELDNLFACLNWQGHFESLAPTVDQLVTPLRNDREAGLVLIDLVNSLADFEIDTWAAFGVMADAIRDEDRPLDAVFDLVLEMIYGVSALQVRSEGFDINDSSTLSGGIMAPAGGLLPGMMTTLLDDGIDTRSWLRSVADNDETERWGKTFSSIWESDDPELSAIRENLIGHVGTTVLAATSPENDSWSGASGNSLRDLADVFVLQPNPLLGELDSEVETILADRSVQAYLSAAILDLYREGTLSGVPDNLLWLISVDVDEKPLRSGEISAFHSFLRLTANADHPVTCSFDVFGFDIGLVEINSLSVALFSWFADQDPDDMQGLAGFLGSAFDNDISYWLLVQAVEAADGTCEGLTTELLADMAVVDVLSADEANDFLRVLIRSLSGLKYADTDLLPTAVDLLSKMYLADSAWPTEEAIRDLHGTPLMGDAATLGLVLLEPTAYGITAEDQAAVDFDDALGVIAWMVETDPSTGLLGWEQARAPMSAALTEDDSWLILDRMARLMIDSRSQMSQLLDVGEQLSAMDPDGVLSEPLSDIVDDDVFLDTGAWLLESVPLSDALMATATQEGQQQVPLAFFGRLVVHGALDDLLALADLILNTLDLATAEE